MSPATPPSPADYVLAERVKLLFGFCAELIPEKERIKEVLAVAEGRASTALAAAPIIGALGGDYEEAHLEAQVRARRAKAIYDLITALEETEAERAELRRTNELKKANLAVVLSHLGMS